MSGSFIERALSFEITLGKGAFGESGSSTVTLSGYRAMVSIVKSGTGGFSQADVQIYGLDLSIMNQVNTLGSSYLIGNQRRNSIAISAGDNVNGMAQIFQGAITMAWSDFTAAPDGFFAIKAMIGFTSALQPALPTSYSGSANVATIMSSLAAQMGMPLENNGISVILSNPYFAGAARQQVAEAARAANINWVFDSEIGPLAIWNKGQSRGGVIPLFSPSTGMIGYPAYTQFGISFRAIYTPGQDPLIGGQVQVESSLAPANGKWVPYQIAYELAAQMPGGDWSMTILCQGIFDYATYGSPLA